MVGETDPRVRKLGNYLAEQMADQRKRPYSEKEDIERRLEIYEEVRDAYRRIFQVRASDDELYQTPINDLDLPVRARRVLQMQQITNLGQLLECTETDLLAMKNMGQYCTNEIKSVLATKGLSLKPDKSS